MLREPPEVEAGSRPKLYDSSLIPIGRITGIDDNGDVVIELEPTEAK